MRPFQTKRRKVLGVAVVAYAFVMCFGGCANTFILFPSIGPLDANGAREVLIPAANGRKVQAWVSRSPGAAGVEPRAFSVEFTGNATRAEQVAAQSARRWGQRPVEVWMVNYPGYGASTGPADLKAIAPAALAAFDHVAAIANGRPILTGGNSLGTAAALYVASQRPVAGVICQNPPAIRSLLINHYGWWNLWLLAGPISWQIPIELDSPTNAARCKAPAIFLLADDDTFVFPPNQMKTVNAYAGPKREIHMTGGHNDALSADAARQLEANLDWLLPPAAPISAR